MKDLINKIKDLKTEVNDHMDMDSDYKELIEDELNGIEKLVNNINYTHSSLELKDKELMSFDELKHLEHKHNVLNKLIGTEKRTFKLQFFENGEWVDIPL